MQVRCKYDDLLIRNIAALLCNKNFTSWRSSVLAIISETQT